MHNALGDLGCYFINYTFWKENFLCLLNSSCKNKEYHYIKGNIHITQKIWHKPSDDRQPVDNIRILCLPLAIMQISKRFQQNVIFYATVLWQKDLKADKVSTSSWSLFTTVELSLKYFLHAVICCLIKQGLIPLGDTYMQKETLEFTSSPQRWPWDVLFCGNPLHLLDIIRPFCHYCLCWWGQFGTSYIASQLL